MIPANEPYLARFKREDDRLLKHAELPVIAWDDEGHALVVDLGRGILVRANSYKDFDGLAEDGARVVAAVPGAGWRAVFKGEDGSRRIEPVVAWKIEANGYTHPVGVHADGLHEDQTHVPDFDQVVAPGEEPVD
ncbi:hypothetical protein [Streptomyces sp. NPDC058066]|uniref:hypothetical protein n=1 Tax=Streptomyces sp. NPDC058066 TaxID=3346323 RepID=UPI0036EA5EB5